MTDTSIFRENRSEKSEAERVLPYVEQPGSLLLVDAIKAAIDDWAEHEMGARDFFYGRGTARGASTHEDGFVSARTRQGSISE